MLYVGAVAVTKSVKSKHILHNELKAQKNPISNVCLDGCTITSKTKSNDF